MHLSYMRSSQTVAGCILHIRDIFTYMIFIQHHAIFSYMQHFHISDIYRNCSRGVTMIHLGLTYFVLCDFMTLVFHLLQQRLIKLWRDKCSKNYIM